MRSSALLQFALLTVISLSSVACADAADRPFAWPNGARAAVNLAYDDALDSQLDIVIPALDNYGFKGSFYVPVGATVLTERLEEWRAAAANGHELGNHSIFHQCSASKPGRDWVAPHNNLDAMSALQMAEQVRVANSVLHMIDGKTARTYTAPCGDHEAGGDNYLELVEPQFVAIKASPGDVPHRMSEVNPYRVSVTMPDGITGDQLIAVVKEAAAKGTMANFTFHGVGGDYLSVTQEAHEQLLAYLAEHPETYYVDTFLNIMNYVESQRREQ